MSFFAMYPPMFRDRRRAMLNLVSLEESAWLLRRGGAFLGLHPEGTRNKGDDPYSLLPAQSGAGRLIYQAKVPVIPVFINGLINDLVRQVASNFDGTGTPVHMVFGAPVDFGDLLERPGSPRLYRQVAERALEAIRVLGQEEKRYRSVTATGSPTDRADDGRVRKAGGDAR
jgi:1-acyl-sn-glycerol-3-phosphate acyltransferase